MFYLDPRSSDSERLLQVELFNVFFENYTSRFSYRYLDSRLRAGHKNPFGGVLIFVCRGYVSLLTRMSSNCSLADRGAIHNHLC